VWNVAEAPLGAVPISLSSPAQKGVVQAAMHYEAPVKTSLVGWSGCPRPILTSSGTWQPLDLTPIFAVIRLSLQGVALQAMIHDEAPFKTSLVGWSGCPRPISTSSGTWQPLDLTPMFCCNQAQPTRLCITGYDTRRGSFQDKPCRLVSMRVPLFRKQNVVAARRDVVNSYLSL
jgi:hypothetical protein